MAWTVPASMPSLAAAAFSSSSMSVPRSSLTNAAFPSSEGYINIDSTLPGRRNCQWRVVRSGVMDLTPVQRRTVEVLRRPQPAFPDEFVEDFRGDLERRLAEIDPPERVVLAKGRLNLLARCEGSFAADLAGEREAFAHRRDTTVGSIAHRAAQADVARRREAEPQELVGYALDRMLEDRALALFWADLAELERSELLAAAVRQLVLFREMFRPLDPSWQPLPELPMTGRLLGNRVTLRGRPDLVDGVPARLAIAR